MLQSDKDKPEKKKPELQDQAVYQPAWNASLGDNFCVDIKHLQICNKGDGKQENTKGKHNLGPLWVRKHGAVWRNTS